MPCAICSTARAAPATGQRSAFYWLVEKELNSDAQSGSVLTLGDAAHLGYRSANLAAEGLYHAGRGGAGADLLRDRVAERARQRVRLLRQPVRPPATAYYLFYDYLEREKEWRKFIPGWEVPSGYA